MRTLLAHMQSARAFRTSPNEICARLQRRRATVATRRGDGLHQSRKARPRDVERRSQALRFRFKTVAVIIRASIILVITGLLVLAIGVHAGFPTPEYFNLRPVADWESRRER